MDTIVLVEGPPLTRRPDRDIRMDATQLYWWEGVRVQIGMLQGVFFNWCPPKKLKYLEPRLGESTST